VLICYLLIFEVVDSYHLTTLLISINIKLLAVSILIKVSNVLIDVVLGIEVFEFVLV